MTAPWFTALFALFVWWFSTGAILLAVRWADRSGGHAHRLTAIGAVPLVMLGLAGVLLSRADTGVSGAYTGFMGALAVWGWIELTFLTGTVAGPSRAPCDAGARGLARLRQAWGAVAHHELLLAFGLLVIFAVVQGQPNAVALWTYLVLFVARIAAKLNLFLGVPRINVEFVPRRLTHLISYFRQGPVTIAFPIAITLLSFTVGCFAVHLWTATTPAETVRFALLAALAALALLEHWLMVLPLPDAKLWRWMLPSPASPTPRPTTPPLMTPTER